MNRLQKDAQEAVTMVLRSALAKLELQVKAIIKDLIKEGGPARVDPEVQYALAATLGSNWAKGKFDIPDIEDLLMALYILGRPLPKITVG